MSPEPDDLSALGKRLDEVRAREKVVRPAEAPAAASGIALRLVTELISAIALGGAVGWGIDWAFGYFGIHTKPVFLILCFMLGAAAGFLGVIRAAQAMNSGSVAEGSVAEDDEES